jgi:hypothetical protein
VIGIFKQKNPGNILLLLLLGILIKLPMFLNPYVPAPGEDDGVLYAGILNLLQPAGHNLPRLYPILAFILMFTQAIVLTRFINNQRMMNRSSYLPGMSYLIITSLIPEWNYFSAPLLVNTILVFLFSAMFKTYLHYQPKGIVFNCGLALGLVSLIYFPAILFGIWILLALLLMRPFRLNEWALTILGLLTPYYFYAIYLFVSGSRAWEKLLGTFTIELPAVEQSLWLAGSTFLLTIPFLMGGYFVQDNLRRMLIQVRKGWSLFLLLLLVAVAVQFVNTGPDLQNWVLLALPMAAFHGCMYLYASLRIIPNLLFWLALAFIIAYQYSGPGW